MAGIAPADADIRENAYHPAGGHCIFSGNLMCYGEGDISNRLVGLPGRKLAPGEELHIRYVIKPQPELAVSLDGKTFTPVPAELKHANYVPCLSLGNSEVTVQIENYGASQHDTSEGRKLILDRLWQDRRFTDCTVTCGSSDFQCHRAVLANASAVWQTALESSFREGRDAKLRIDDSDPGVVEALLKYAYTSEFEFGDAAATLGLAHRYEMPSLVALCAQQMLEDVTVENVGKIASAMNVYGEHKEVKVRHD